MNYTSALSLIVNQVRARTPKVTGNLTRNTRMFVYKQGDIFGRLEINTPYAQFVDYGAIQHPMSKKLKKDYTYVEKSLNQALKVIVEAMGGGVIK